LSLNKQIVLNCFSYEFTKQIGFILNSKKQISLMCFSYEITKSGLICLGFEFKKKIGLICFSLDFKTQIGFDLLSVFDLKINFCLIHLL
jgi:hypothetical protein